MVEKNRLYESGQALLIILLVMTVGLTIGLSSIGRSSTDIKISTQMEDSARAFAAAEAGIEAALKGETSGNGTFSDNKATYTFTSAAAGNSSQFRVNNVSVGDTYTVWLVKHNDTDGTLDPSTGFYNSAAKKINICWEKAESVDPSMEITLVYQQTGSNGPYQIFRGAYKAPSDLHSNNFAASGSYDCGLGFNYGVEFDYSTAPLFYKAFALRLRPFYGSANIGVQAVGSGVSLPQQGIEITSTGTSGESTRKVKVTRTYPVLPAIFDYILFSGGSLTK